jgi:glycosyltransferase involved in cell wall biosynthesis
MRISGFLIVRNGSKFDYPFLESIQSILPICDEFVIAVGHSEDDTLDKIRALGSSKIRIIETIWDESLRTGGHVLADQTNIALDQVTGDWAFYLQADEVIHERDLPGIIRAMEQHLHNVQVEGFLFPYLHFFGSYRYVGSSRQWYRHEVRIVRPGIGVRSWKDAQGFRINGRKLFVVPIDATIYHYGWVKPPTVQLEKQRSFNRLWHTDEWIQRRLGELRTYDYQNGTKLRRFEGTHPAVMKARVEGENWGFEYDPSKVRQSVKERVLEWIEEEFGWRIGEYKNYNLL